MEERDGGGSEEGRVRNGSKQIGEEIREMEKDPEMEGRESDMSQRNRDRGQTRLRRDRHRGEV